MIRIVAHWCLKLWGWTPVGSLPSTRCVVIAAPHTSNWDFPIALLVAAALKTRINWLGKDTLFRFPFGGIMRALGGIPVDRSKSNNMVDAMVQTFGERDYFITVIPPEATRSHATRWKTGFYHIAHQANVPIVFGFLDFAKKIGGFGPSLVPTGDIEADFEQIRAFYVTITGKRPDKMGAITIANTDGNSDDNTNNNK